MENASKALIMAGSILITLLVIGIVSLTYNRLSTVKQTESDVEESTKSGNYVKSFEQYNKTIYGSELLSLGNLQADYNIRQAELQGYTPISITVQITKAIIENQKTYLNTGTQDLSTVRNALFNLEEDIEYYEKDKYGYNNKKERIKRSVKYYAQLSYRQIATLFEIPYSSGETDYDIGERLANQTGFTNSKVPKLLADIENLRIQVLVVIKYNMMVLGELAQCSL